MESRTITSGRAIIADLAAFADGQPFLVVEVKAMNGATAIAAGWLVELLIRIRKSKGLDIPFGMVVDLDNILVFDVRKADPTISICQFKTKDILEAFDPDFARKRIFDDYLLALVETWLQKFGWRQTLAAPSGMKEFAEVGLADLLIRSSIYRKVHLADADPVH